MLYTLMTKYFHTSENFMLTKSFRAGSAVVLLGVIACDSTTSPTGKQAVGISFSTLATTAAGPAG